MSQQSSSWRDGGGGSSSWRDGGGGSSSWKDHGGNDDDDGDDWNNWWSWRHDYGNEGDFQEEQQEEPEAPSGSREQKRKHPFNFAKYRRKIKRETQRECAYHESVRLAKIESKHEAEKKQMQEDFEKEIQDAKNESMRLNGVLEQKVKQRSDECNELMDEGERLQAQITRLTMMAASASTKASALEQELATALQEQVRKDEKLRKAERKQREYETAIRKWKVRVEDLKQQLQSVQVGSWGNQKCGMAGCNRSKALGSIAAVLF